MPASNLSHKKRGSNKTANIADSTSPASLAVVLLVTIVIALFPSISSLAKTPPEKTGSQSDTKPAAARAKKTTDEQPPRLEPTEVYHRLLKSTAWIRFVDKDGVSWEGTGWVVDADKGLLVTNKHVVSGVDKVKVYFPVEKDGETALQRDHYLREVKPLIGQVIDRDTDVDLALVKVEKLPKGILALPLASSSPEPGQRVFALGSQPEGSEGMWIFTTGEVRQVYRRRHALGHVARIVETQLPTNCGNSGGAVVNDRAQVVAVVEGHSTIARLVSLFVDISELRDYLHVVVPLADPRTAKAYNLRGTRRHDEGRYDQAIEDYTQSLRIDHNQPVVLTNRGWSFYSKEDFDAAVADFDEALQQDKHNASAYEGRGAAYREMGDYKRAIKDLTNAIRHAPGDPSIYQRRATAYQRNGQLEKALADRNRAVEGDPDNFDYVYQRGQTLRKLRRFDEALRDFNRAASLKPGRANVCYEIGYVYQDRKEYPQAVFFYDLAIKRKDSEPAFYNNRGLCKIEMEAYLDAGRDFLKAIELRPNHAPYHRRLGIVFHEAGQHKIALKHFNKAVELDPTDPGNFDWRADCHEALGDEEAAAKDREKMEMLKS